jgi:hypothetical protein
MINVRIPFVKGDSDGVLTSALVWQWCASGNGTVSLDADYRLEVQIIEDKVDTVGYRLDKQKIDQKIRKHLTQNEERRSVIAEVSLVEIASGKTVQGPIRVSAYTDYDYIDGDSLSDLQFATGSNTIKDVLLFSLGQLESQESAHEAAQWPLYQKISQKIIDAVRLR